MNRHGLSFLCGKINVREYRQELDAINLKLDQKKRVNFPFPRKNTSLMDFNHLVSMDRQTLVDRLRQIIRISKENRHFSLFYMDLNEDLNSSNRLPYMLSKRQMRKRFLHSQQTFGHNGSRIPKDDLDSFNKYITLANLDEYSDTSTSLTRVPKPAKDLKVIDLVTVLRNRSDGESIFRSILESSFEADKSLRVSVYNMFYVIWSIYNVIYSIYAYNMVHIICVNLYTRVLYCFFSII